MQPKTTEYKLPIDNILSKTCTFFTSYLLFFQSIINVTHTFHPHNTVLQIYDFFLICKENFNKIATTSFRTPTLACGHPSRGVEPLCPPTVATPSTAAPTTPRIPSVPAPL